MKTLITNKRALVILVILSFLALVFFLNSRTTETEDEDSSGRDISNVQDRLDAEITEESEGLEEGLEDEIEGYIEEDISELDVNEEEGEEEVNGEEGEAREGEADFPVLPFTRKNYPQNELRIGFMTDLHAGSNAGESRSDRIIKEFFRESVNHFIREMNDKFFPDFLLLNGDVIEGTNWDQEVGSGELRSIKKLFDQTLIPKYWVVGNHDLRAVNKYFWKKSLEIDYLTKSFDVRDYRIIILDSNFDPERGDIEPGKYYTRGLVSREQIKWLEKELETDKKKIVFIHHPPLWSVDVRSNSGLPLNALALQEVFREGGVSAVFAGHIEDFYYDKIDGVKYFVIPGVKKNKKYQGTFAEISFRDDKVEMDVNYLGSNGQYRKVNIKELVE